MRRPPRFAVCLVLPLTLLAPHAAAPAADEPPRLKTQVVKLKLAAGIHRGAAIELVQLPPGKIVLKGADGNDRAFEIKPIWVAKFETRWDEYDVFYHVDDVPEDRRQLEDRQRSRGELSYLPPDGGYDSDSRSWESPGHDGFPANCIGLRGAQKYCAWLSGNTGKKFRLPTEAEWEYACRAGGPAARPDAKALDAVAWFAGNSDETNHAVGQKRPNAWGLYDMLGNVAEYVIRDSKDDNGLLAGGSYKDQAKDVHCGAREAESPAWHKNDPQTPPSRYWLNWTVHHVGFRVVMEE